MPYPEACFDQDYSDGNGSWHATFFEHILIGNQRYEAAENAGECLVVSTKEFCPDLASKIVDEICHHLVVSSNLLKNFPIVADRSADPYCN
jgi:hypothetical protein